MSQEPTDSMEQRLEILKYQLLHEEELFKATSAFEHVALRPLFLLNGGALVAALTFLGVIVEGGEKSIVEITPIIHAIFAWGVGLFLAACTAAFGYYSQFNFLKAARAKRKAQFALGDSQHSEQLGQQAKEHGDKGENTRRLAEAAAALSLLLFLFGVISSSFALGKIF